MTTAQATAGQRIVLNDVSWDFYQRMLTEVGDGRVRLTYDRGRMEIVSPSNVHEMLKTVIARIIEAYADAIGIEVEGPRLHHIQT